PRQAAERDAGAAAGAARAPDQRHHLLEREGDVRARAALRAAPEALLSGPLLRRAPGVRPAASCALVRAPHRAACRAGHLAQAARDGGERGLRLSSLADRLWRERHAHWPQAW